MHTTIPKYLQDMPIVLIWKIVNCPRKGGFIVSYVWEIAVRKSLTIFEGCHFLRFYIIDLTEFSENRDKEFQFGSMIFSIVLNWGYHLLHISLNVYTLEEVKRCHNHSWAFFRKILCKVKQKVFEIFKLPTWEENIQRCPIKQILNLFVLLLLLSYSCILEFRKKHFFLLLLHDEFFLWSI